MKWRSWSVVEMVDIRSGVMGLLRFVAWGLWGVCGLWVWGWEWMSWMSGLGFGEYVGVRERDEVDGRGAGMLRCRMLRSFCRRSLGRGFLFESWEALAGYGRARRDLTDEAGDAMPERGPENLSAPEQSVDSPGKLHLRLQHKLAGFPSSPKTRRDRLSDGGVYRPRLLHPGLRGGHTP